MWVMITMILIQGYFPGRLWIKLKKNGKGVWHCGFSLEFKKEICYHKLSES